MKSYILVLKLHKKIIIRVGRLGEILFLPGKYLYIGSGRKYLHARIKRHLRKNKRLRWHIDYLTASQYVDVVKIFVSELEEQELVQKILNKFGNQILPVKGFGSSDSTFHSHLFYTPDFIEDYLHSFVNPLTL